MLLKEKREEARKEIDPRKLEELKKQANRTEELAGCIIGDTMNGGSADPEPPKLLDAVVDIAYGARLIRKGTKSLSDC